MNLLRKQQEAQAAVEDWNKRFEIGQPVRFEPMRGAPRIESKTRSVAWEACGQALVMIEGQAGGVALDFLCVALVEAVE